jgi:3-(3-hydroxy-phenyl)propionate hydroxylase
MLAKRHAFARRLVNSGRLSVPATLTDSPLNTPDIDAFSDRMARGAPAADAPVAGSSATWFLECLGEGFTLVVFAAEAVPSLLHDLAALAKDPIACRGVLVGVGEASLPAGVTCIGDPDGRLAERYDARPGTAYLFRPDQHVCARWRAFDGAQVRAAIARAISKVCPLRPTEPTERPLNALCPC